MPQVNALPQVDELMEACAEACRRGGEVLRERFGQRRSIEFKGGIDLVTDADRASEKVVLAFLRDRFPGAAVLAEESGVSAATGGAGSAGAGLRFVVDPLDGTTNYAHGLPQFAVNVAAEDRGGIIAGATYDPLRDELFVAGRDKGATLNGEAIHVSDAKSLGDSLLCTGFPYDVHQHAEAPLQLFGAFLKQARAVRRLGSAALDLAYVACGRFDGFWEIKLKAWDMTPGILLIREAGGVVSDFVGGDAMVQRSDICAGNARIHGAILEVIRGDRRSNDAGST